MRMRKTLGLCLILGSVAALATLSGCGGSGSTAGPTLARLLVSPDNSQDDPLNVAAGGSISGSGTTVTWTAPDVVGTYTITCTVEDGYGGEASDSVEVAVSTTDIIIQ